MTTNDGAIDDVPDRRIEVLERRLARERAARKEAERLLEEKSRELWEANVLLADAVQRLEHLSSHDPLTGLSNRRALAAWISVHAQHEPRQGRDVGLLAIDVDRFKEINDELGHAAGDEVLRVIAGRLAEAVRAEDLVVRLGGDEFVVLLAGVTGPEAAKQVAEKVRASAMQPLELAGTVIHPSISVGVAVHDPGDDPETVFNEADEAMYRAKRAAGGRVVSVSAGTEA